MTSFESANNSSSDSVAWRQRIRTIQTERVTPEVLQRIEQSATRQKRAVKAYKNAQYLERINYVSSASNAVTLRSYASSVPSNEGVNYEETANKHSVRSNNLQTMLFSRKKQSTMENDSEDDAEKEVQLRQIEEDLLSDQQQFSVQNTSNPHVHNEHPLLSDVGVDVSVQAATSNLEVEGLLEQLAVEPSDDKELAAKFMLFENFLATVSAIRDQTLAFWDENKDQFNGASRAACDKDIKMIDSDAAMGIEDKSHKWFVYHMTLKANQNHAAITQTLAMLRSRLHLLAQELGECPCCLDPLLEETCTTLSCCHKVCSECWTHWTEIKGSAAFCPLCKHQQFVEEVIGTFA